MLLQIVNSVFIGILSFLILFTTLTHIPVHHVDKVLQPYYDKYMFFVNNSCNSSQYFYPRQTLIEMSDLSGETSSKKKTVVIGDCTTSDNIFRVRIDKDFFKWSTDEEKFEVVAHELNHCLFKAGHSGDPTNYMYPILPVISSLELNNQIEVDLEKACGDKHGH